MATQRPHGDYGIDAPWVPWMWVGYTVVYAALTVAAATLWEAWWWVVVILGLVTVASAAGAVLYWHTSLRGKFILWDGLLDRVTLPPGASILDVGCGHGTVSIMAALRFPGMTVTGIDLWRSVDQSGNTLTAAQANAAVNGVEDRVRFETGDMTELPYPDGSFELVTASLAIHNIQTREARRRAIGEAVRVLAPGGRIVIADIRRAGEYADDLRAAGLTVTTAPLGWRGWWSGPWVATTAVDATR
ncbi:class I SAM-dependent methyltransferase [Leifsonia sp. ZF2019]|uniref:class I SAM-dependent methyltransferase n=1 Tax=Leifsonia sp. ZF2019 TaxID=2781978 RepID=UPI001CBC8E86|nr:class I SAM-dependent methyltransferase [Leifsonia sp. ZF2019]UAJ80389.1 class I SAM-dependent methyltransferase [Leifsonia sp. ZF2019]